jgi:hypothetical protein
MPATLTATESLGSNVGSAKARLIGLPASPAGVSESEKSLAVSVRVPDKTIFIAAEL